MSLIIMIAFVGVPVAARCGNALVCACVHVCVCVLVCRPPLVLVTYWNSILRLGLYLMIAMNVVMKAAVIYTCHVQVLCCPPDPLYRHLPRSFDPIPSVMKTYSPLSIILTIYWYN